jgi:hypothetical protein
MTSDAAPPVALRVAALTVAVEGLACLATAVGFLFAALFGHPADRGVAFTLAALLLVLSAGLLAIGRGLWRQRPAAATPAYLAQFFALVVAYYQRHTLVAVTFAVTVVSIVAVAGLSAPESRAALRR